jgi:hypothetical protein
MNETRWRWLRAWQQHQGNTQHEVAPLCTFPGWWRSGKGPRTLLRPSQRCWQQARPARQPKHEDLSEHSSRKGFQPVSLGRTHLDQGQQALRWRQLIQLSQQVWQHLKGRAVLSVFVLPAHNTAVSGWQLPPSMTSTSTMQHPWRQQCLQQRLSTTAVVATTVSWCLPVHVREPKLSQALLPQLKQVGQSQLPIGSGLAPAAAGGASLNTLAWTHICAVHTACIVKCCSRAGPRRTSAASNADPRLAQRQPRAVAPLLSRPHWWPPSLPPEVSGPAAHLWPWLVTCDPNYSTGYVWTRTL